MTPHFVKLECHGPVAFHDMPCAVGWLEGASAVYDMNAYVFRPSWTAQARGWHLVHATTWWQRLVLRLAFHVPDSREAL